MKCQDSVNFSANGGGTPSKWLSLGKRYRSRHGRSHALPLNVIKNRQMAANNHKPVGVAVAAQIFLHQAGEANVWLIPQSNCGVGE